MNGHQRKKVHNGTLTARGIAGMAVGEWASDPAARGAGVLQVRRLANGAAAYYYRHTDACGRRVRIPIGVGIDLKDARKRAAELSGRYQAGERDLRAALDEEQRERRKVREAARKADEDAAARDAGTLGCLLTAYADALERRGKPSAANVRSVVSVHVERAAPRIWRMPAVDVTADDVLDLLAPMIDAGKLRTADKLRSIVRSAFAAAIAARRRADALPALRAFRVTTNPAAALPPVEGSRRVRERALSVAEVRAYWRRVNAVGGTDGALLRFHLMTGAQRAAQLQRATVRDVDPDARALILRDPKGRRQEPRVHVVPLLREAEQAMATMRKVGAGNFVVSVDGGLTGASYFVLAERVRSVAAAMVEAGETTEPFTVGDLRRTVETRLSALGVLEEVRAQLQSHGLGGVQARHYDRHDYLQEKHAALRALLGLLDGRDGANVATLRRKAAR